MIQIPIYEKRVTFETDLGIVVVATRSYLSAEFATEAGTAVVRESVLDSGAPWGVLPHGFWHRQRIVWRPLGSQIRRTDQTVFKQLEWHGVPCQLGETLVVLTDEPSDTRTPPLRLVAKFPERIGPPVAEAEVLLGQCFILDNSLGTSMKGVGGYLQAMLTLD